MGCTSHLQAEHRISGFARQRGCSAAAVAAAQSGATRREEDAERHRQGPLGPRWGGSWASWELLPQLYLVKLREVYFRIWQAWPLISNGLMGKRGEGTFFFCKNQGIRFPATPKLRESTSALSIPRLPLGTFCQVLKNVLCPKIHRIWWKSLGKTSGLFLDWVFEDFLKPLLA